MTHTANIDETRDYAVAGMTCTHCASSVREEVAGLPAVHAVDVDVAAGLLTVTGSGLDDDEIRAAVAGAGYGVV